MDEKNVILEAMRKAGEPVNAGKVAELTGLDRKVVDKVFAQLKKEGSIVSPVRCKWTPACPAALVAANIEVATHEVYEKGGDVINRMKSGRH